MTNLSRTLRGRLRGGADDSGVTLVETIVALVVFGLMATAALAGLITMLSTSRADRSRVQAANLATQQLEVTRNLPTSVIENRGTTATTKTIGGAVYTVTETVELERDSLSTSTCTGGGGTNPLAYVRIEELVTWSGMGAIKPVRVDSLRAINIAGLDATTGELSVNVQGGAQQAQSGAVVTVTNASGYSATQTTGDDGCAVFVGVPPGAVTATATGLGGYVDYNGNATAGTIPTTSTTVTAGTLSQATIAYDNAGAVTANLPAGAQTQAAGDMGVTLYNSTLGSTIVEPICGTTPHCVSSATRTMSGLFPFSGGYTIWAGTCNDAKPTLTANQQTVAVPAGGTGTITLNLAKVTITKVAAGTVTATHAADVGSGCTAGETHTMTAPAGVSTMYLPYGTWSLGKNALGITQTVTLTAALPTAAVSLA